MICTELLRSPYIGEAQAEWISRQLQTRLSTDNWDGREIYNYTSGQLQGSFDHRVCVAVEREMWVPYDDVRHPKTGKAPAKVKTLPFVTIEGSVHKAMMGHNVYGGPLCPVESARWFVADVTQHLGLDLPPGDRWHFDRVDQAEAYDVGSLAAALEIKRSFELARYTRREPTIYPATVMFPGNTSTWKIYVKGLEFEHNDYKRVAATMGKHKAEELQEQANKLIRVELSVKQRLITERINLMAGEDQKKGSHYNVETLGCSRWNVGGMAISRDWLEDTHNKETERVLRDGEQDMETVRNHDDVRRRLYEVHGPRVGRTLYGTWSALALSGEEYVRQSMTKTTFYRHAKQLRNAGVSWIGSDVFVGERSSLIPVGFSLARNSPFRLTGEAPEVVQALAPFRIAA